MKRCSRRCITCPERVSSPILQVLIELGLREKVEVKTLTFPELKQAAHLAVNPMGTSPAFQDGEVRIWESQAVLTHLLEMHDTSHRLHPPPRTSKRVKHLHLQTFLMATVYPHVASLYLHTLKPAEEQDATYVSASKSKWTQTIAPVLVDALADQPYLLGDEISAVDLVITALCAMPTRLACLSPSRRWTLSSGVSPHDHRLPKRMLYRKEAQLSIS